ncbi:MAG: streptomycin resistance protein [Francisellaceae bacterium]|nr:streptomycin resistance protein [Francisellaceae bacterium]
MHLQKPLNLNPRFVANIKANYGHMAEEWLNLLPKNISFLANKWQFKLIKTLDSLSCNYLGLIQLNGHNEKAILKMAPIKLSLKLEAYWLKSFNPFTPLVYHLDEALNALMLEHMVPGTSLKALVQQGQDNLATKIISQVILDLHTVKLNPHFKFPHLSSFSKDLKILQGHIDNKLFLKCESLFFKLTRPSQEDRLIHGDLHHDNILNNGEHWKVIDPHGYIGNPIAEIGPMIFNPVDCFPKTSPLKTILKNRLDILSKLLPYSQKEIKDWALCRALLSAAWDIQASGKIMLNQVEIAQAIDNLY